MAHTLTLYEAPGALGTVSFWSGCSCNWEGGSFSTDPRVPAFHSVEAGECEAAAVEQGDEHRAGQS